VLIQFFSSVTNMYGGIMGIQLIAMMIFQRDLYKEKHSFWWILPIAYVFPLVSVIITAGFSSVGAFSLLLASFLGHLVVGR